MATVSAFAADLPSISALSPSSIYNWTGFYVGSIAGPAQGSYDPRTAAIPGNYLSAPADIAAVAAGGAQSIKPTGFSAGAEAGYNWQSGHWLLGIETDLSAIHLNGAVSGSPVSLPVGPPVNFHGRPDRFFVNSYADADWLYTFRPRVGFVQNNWLFYATGGLALTSLRGDFTFTDGNTRSDAANIQQSGRVNNTLSVGYAVGAGAEVGLTDRLSVKAEYLHVNFPDAVAAQTFIVFATASPNQSFRQSIDLHADFLRLGLNYRFGGPDLGPGDTSILPFKARPFKAASSDWEVDVGTRTWLSSGRYGGQQPLLSPSPVFLESRLTYSNINALSGEAFGRLDHASGFFVKGYLGAGGGSSGGLNDEDFPLSHVYSNTFSPSAQHIAYATIDAGYTFLRAPGAKVGAFIGYNYYAQDINAYGCTQLAGDPAQCTGAFNNFPGITDNNKFNSVRVGLSSEMMLTDRLKLTGDIAYVPGVAYRGLDAHNAGELLSPEASSNGSGVMLETILSYGVTEHWNVGVGGRYWAWNMNTGSAGFDFLGRQGQDQILNARYNAERYGAFLQADYHWGDTTRSPASGTIMPVKAQATVSANWTGFYMGGHLGGAVSDDRWADPFGSQPSLDGSGFLNVAGFGDTIHANGPLGGIQAGYNLQAGKWVFGLQSDVSAAALRGENTCFSGLGGLNCQRAVTSLGSITGRFGYAWDSALVYAKGGTAWTKTTYDVLGNTIALSLGEDRAHPTEWGWTAGIGIEYAFSSHWSTFIEYDHIGLPSVAVPTPTVFVAAAHLFPITPMQAVSVRTSIDMVKMGVNYRFNVDGLVAAKN
jgi:opacity protein-like surface antigen